jgi:twitching motility protein PilU
VLADLIMEKRGLILMVGATGTGKSTTLAAMMEWRNQRDGPHPDDRGPDRVPVHEQEVGGQPARDRLRHRQPPDRAEERAAPGTRLILIGEIRDRDTMTAALAYAQSGHLCLATMHANNSYQALNRILSFYPLEARGALLSDLSSGLKAVVSQRLLRGKEPVAVCRLLR